MIEQVLEKTIIDKFEDALAGLDIQVYGAWQPAGEDDLKAEDEGREGVVTVKVLPRSYETPTIPYAQFQVQVSLLVRSDVDFNGMGYLQVTNLLADVMHGWQNGFDAFHEDFAYGGFEPTGFQLDGGDCGIDKTAFVWTFSQAFTIYGIIQH